MTPPFLRALWVSINDDYDSFGGICGVAVKGDRSRATGPAYSSDRSSVPESLTNSRARP